MIKKFLNEHQTISSVLTIILSMMIINGWLISDVRSDVREIREDVREVTKRIDSLYHFVLSKQPLGK